MGSQVEFIATKTVESGEPEKVPRFLEDFSDKIYLVSEEILEDNAVESCHVKNETSEETVGMPYTSLTLINIQNFVKV